MRKSLFIIGLLLIITKTTAQNVLSGTVFLKSDKIVDASVSCIDPLNNTVISETKSDFEGYYSFKLTQKEVIVKVTYLDIPEFVDTVKINETGITYFNINLREAIKTSVNIKVNKKQVGGGTIAGVRLQQDAAGMLNIVSREEFSKINASKGTDVLKRIPGTTIVEGKFANIRGMNDRYNAGYLNGAPMPATESDRKAFSFDIIPANLIDNIVVLKAGTPNLTGDFGGGIIQINTRSIPDKRVQNFGFGLQYHSLTTFKSIQTFDNGNMEALGVIDKDHQIPSLSGKLTGTPAENSAQTAKFNNNWNTQNIRPSLAPRFNYSIGLPVKINKKKELGVIASVNYAYSPKYGVGDVRVFDLSDNRKIRDYSDRNYSVNVQNGGLLNLAFKFNNRNRIDFRNLYNINYDASSNFRTGLSDADDNKYTDAYSGYSNQNQLFNSQLSGTHSIATKANSKNQLLLTWNLNSSTIRRFMPDYRIAQYSIFEDTNRIFVFNDFFNAGSGRFFSSLKERTLNATVDLAYSFEMFKMKNALKGGIYAQNRERTFTSRRFVYAPINKYFASHNTPATDLTTESLAKHGMYLLEKTSSDIDEYDGTANLNAGYLMMENEIPFIKVSDNTKNIKLIYGVRVEQFEQKLNNDAFRKLNKWVSNQGSITDILPSFNFVVPTTFTTQLRGGYYKSLNRPEMRELAPFSFYNFSLNSEILGNTLLKRAEIHNFDLRFELYNGGSNTITLGAFYKRIINPIEMSLDPTQPGIRTFTYKNERMAEVQGAEIEARQNIGKLINIKRKSFLNNLTLYTNFALIKSQVSFFSTSTGTPNRPLQGQSPFVSNTSLFYESEKGFILNLNFNKIGDRIAYIGTPKSIQPYGLDIYEYGRSIFDIQTGFNFGKGKNKNQQIRLNISDLFAQRSVFYQDNNQNKKFDKGTDNELISLKNGRTITLNYNITF